MTVELIETLFRMPVWLCQVGHGCVCGDGCDQLSDEIETLAEEDDDA